MVNFRSLSDVGLSAPVVPSFISSISLAFLSFFYEADTKGSAQKMYKYSLYNSTRLIKPNP